MSYQISRLFSGVRAAFTFFSYKSEIKNTQYPKWMEEALRYTADNPGSGPLVIGKAFWKTSDVFLVKHLLLDVLRGKPILHQHWEGVNCPAFSVMFLIRTTSMASDEAPVFLVFLFWSAASLLILMFQIFHQAALDMCHSFAGVTGKRSELSSGSSELLHKWAHTDLAVVAGQAVMCCPVGWATARWADPSPQKERIFVPAHCWWNSRVQLSPG